MISRKIYVGYAKNTQTILETSSGGIFEIIARVFFDEYKDNAALVGVVWDHDYKGAHHEVVYDVKDLYRVKKSKYVQSKKNNIFNDVKKMLKDGEYVLFSGTPCEIAGLKSFLGNEYNNLITLDFICKGPTSEIFLKKYIEEREIKYKSKVTGIDMRYKWLKLDNWIPQFIRIDFKNGKKYINEFYNTDIGHAFRIVQRPSCYNCQFTGLKKVSDITVGDYHGLNKQDKIYNNLGVSIFFSNTAKGDKILDMVKNKTVFEEREWETLNEQNIYLEKCVQIHPKRDELLDKIKNYSLSYSIKKICNFKEMIKLYIPWKIQRKLIFLLRRVKKNGA